ncbi:MAG TPA: permease-like cell division protein FtsX [Anaerovoracaceae bacterium]|nr:permease-like cell division protein FtsX [Anaerovoracaceae bacterium]
MFRTMGYNIKQALSQINRNKAMTFTSVLAITAMMLILGLFFVATININLFAEVVKQDFDMVEIYMEDDTSEGIIKQIAIDYEGQESINKVEFRSKEDALEIMKQRWGDSGYLLENLGDNPLPNSLIVYVADAQTAKKVAESAIDFDGVEDVKYYQETVEKLTQATDFIQLASLVIMIFLVLVSIVVVSNTIKLTVFARAKEIRIMKYIGATNWFVRGPFFVEGIIIGLIAAAISTGLVSLIYDNIMSIIGADIIRILSVPIVPLEYLAINLAIIFAALGVGIGSCGSVVSMRRFLDK